MSTASKPARALPASLAFAMAGYLFALAYVASFATYRIALALGGGLS